MDTLCAMMRTYLPDKIVLPSLGNHEGVPVDRYVRKYILHKVKIKHDLTPYIIWFQSIEVVCTTTSLQYIILCIFMIPWK